MLHSFTWDQYFMTLTYLVAMKSKDPSTRVGAVVVGPNNEIRATGFNGLPRGIMDYKLRYDDREYKLMAVNHAEENAILNCALNGISAFDCKIYSQWQPCARCAKSIIQAGIKEVIYDGNFPGNNSTHITQDWRRSIHISKELLSEAGVEVRIFQDNFIEIKGLYNKQSFAIPTIEHPHDIED